MSTNLSYKEHQMLQLSRDIRVTILIEVIERNGGKSLVAPVEFTCEIGKHQYDCCPEDVSEHFLCIMATNQYWAVFTDMQNNDKVLSSKISGHEWCFDATVLERHNITFGEIFKKLGIK